MHRRKRKHVNRHESARRIAQGVLIGFGLERLEDRALLSATMGGYPGAVGGGYQPNHTLPPQSGGDAAFVSKPHQDRFADSYQSDFGTQRSEPLSSGGGFVDRFNQRTTASAYRAFATDGYTTY